MTAFDKCFLFLDSPRGGVENLSDMKAAGFDGLFANCRDYPAHEWETVIVPRAKQLGMFCGPWGRTATATHQWDESVLDNLIAVADRWGSPLVVNSEIELKDSGAALTSLIATKVGKRDAALSTEPWLFASVDWNSVSHLPVLLQIFPAEQSTTKTEEQRRQCKGHAHEVGVRCVYFTFGTYGGQKPGDFDLKAPFSLFTGDAMGAAYAPWSPTSSGFVGCPKPPAPQPEPGVTMLTEKQVPYTGPYYGPTNSQGPSKGPTAVALKRAMVRMGLLQADLGQLDEVYGLRLEAAIHYFQTMLEDVAATGQYGKGTWYGLRAAKVPKGRPNAGQFALDKLAQEMIQREWKADQVADAPVTKVRNAITDFCVRAEAHEAKWTYTQRRAYTGLGVAPENAHGNDCSSYVVLAYYWAREETGVLVPDPAGFAYNGYGNTWDKLDDHDHVSGTYLVGDLACYDGHVTLCRKKGDFRSAIWSSFGREAGPEDVSLYYRDDVRFVCRPDLVP